MPPPNRILKGHEMNNGKTTIVKGGCGRTEAEIVAGGKLLAWLSIIAVALALVAAFVE